MGSGGIAPPFLISALHGGEWSVSSPRRFTPGGRSLGYPFDRRLSGSQSCGEEKHLLALPGIEFLFLGRPARRYTGSSFKIVCRKVNGTFINLITHLLSSFISHNTTRHVPLGIQHYSNEQK
jgi:hypothetical protein